MRVQGAEITALVVVDVQPTFMPGGGLPVTDGEAVVPVINRLMQKFDHVVFTQDWHIDPGDHFSDNPDFSNSWPVHGVAGTSDAELHPDLDTSDTAAFIKKGEREAAYSGFEGATGDGRTLEQVLKDLSVDHVYVCGLATDYCVKQTVLDSVRLGFKTTVLLGATRGVLKASTDEAINEMRKKGAEIDWVYWVEPPESL